MMKLLDQMLELQQRFSDTRMPPHFSNLSGHAILGIGLGDQNGAIRAAKSSREITANIGSVSSCV